MRKLYLLGLVLSTFIINSYVADNTAFDNPADSAKITHFYPNPATSYINFTFDKTVDKNYTLQVYNFLGRKMNDIRISDSKLTINLDDNYFRGLYVYQLRDQSGRIVESGKFQVNK
ncbi:MAG: T9SS type A sorting domain-containing protein [Bacteroidota bacterium]